MRVHLFGSVLNNAVVLAKALAAEGIDTRAFVPDDPKAQAQDRPEWEYGKGGVPDRIVVRVPAVQPLRPSHARFLRAFTKADVLHVFGTGPLLLAPAIGALPPTIFHSYGGDLQLIPWMHNGIRERVLARMQRRGIRRADYAVIQPYQRPFLERLNYRGKVRDDLPFMADFDNLANVVRDEEIARRYAKYRLVVYSPARQAYDTHPDIGPYAKNNYVGIEGFARFVSEEHLTPEDVRLVIVRKGPNASDSIALIEKLGIGAFVDLLDEHPKNVVYSFLALERVVVIDQFPRPVMTMGGIAREALAHGCPLITKTDVALTASQYRVSTIPLLYAETPADVAVHLRSMLNDDARARQRGDAKSWAAEHLADNSLLVRALLEIYRELTAKR